MADSVSSDRRQLSADSDITDRDFREIRDIIKGCRDFDLAQYKDRCIRRRIARRARSLGYGEIAPYIERLRSQPEEVDALLAALTIHVSQFFRNPSTFDALGQRILPELMARARGEGRQGIVLWSVGCASGEEPYSLALVAEQEATAGVRITIRASDVSSGILARAREGLFDPMRLAEVSDELLARHFEPEGRSYRLHARLRARVEFFRHDILGPEPYPGADLILCRNVLIYFSREEQDNIFRRFARALPEGGFLVLGRAENLLGEPRDYFSCEDLPERIYRRNATLLEEERGPARDHRNDPF